MIKIADFQCIPLQEVREIANKYRGMVNKNIDPLVERDRIRDVPTLKEFSKTYLEWACIHKRSWKDDENKLKADILPVFGNRRLNDISSREIQAYLERIKGRTSGAHSNRHRSLWSKMFSLAILWAVFEGENPCAKIPKFPEGSGRLRYLTNNEIKKFLTVLDEYGVNASTQLLQIT